MDAHEIRQEFEARGVVRLDAAFSQDQAAAMRTLVWGYAERKGGLRPDDPSTWPANGHGASWKGINRNPVFDPLTGNAAVRGALDAIFGVGGWRPPRSGAQILVTLPQPGPWVLPSAWHMDGGFEHPTWPVLSVKLFSFFGDVAPEGGGTMLLPGTHRLVECYRQGLPPGTGGGMKNWRPFMKHHPWLAGLLEGEKQADGGRSLVGQSHEVDGVPVDVMELTGRPGDVVLTHLHTFHTKSPNTGGCPREMLGKEIHRTREPATS